MQDLLANVEADVLSQFGAMTHKFTVASCPHLAVLVAERIDNTSTDKLTDERLLEVVKLALAFGERSTDAIGATADRQIDAELAGGKAYFFFDGYPSNGELEQISAAQDATGTRIFDIHSQVCRFSWAKWQFNRELKRNAEAAPHSRGGFNQKDAYAHALATVLVDAFNRIAEFREFVDQRSKGWSLATQELLSVSVTYSNDVAVDSDLHVIRTIEPDLVDQLRDPFRTWPRVVVGEAGSGKSTLLWSLQYKLNQQTGVRALFLSASWVLQQNESGFKAQLLDALEEFRRSGYFSILLFDTADLMLHDESSRQYFHALMAAVESRNFPSLYSTRPQEFAQINSDSLRSYELAPYDDNELDRAVVNLARRYCPHVEVGELVTRIRGANARWLPVADVCRSPLLIRMMFDLSAPDEPELDDVDVTLLLGAYWERRVRRDARYESATVLRTRPDQDLSSLAGLAGVGLLVTGKPELPGETLEESTKSCLGQIGMSNTRTVREGFDILLERGILTRNGSLLGFFHQTMLEFASAKGLLQIAHSNIFHVVAERTASRDGDLFVGAALEQTLILAGHNPLLKSAVQSAVETVIGSTSEAVQAIGLVAWAHHHCLIPEARQRLQAIGGLALQRSARILPSIASKDTGMTISQLILIWDVAKDTRTRSIVLQSFARLGLRAPEDVAEAIEYINPLQTISNGNNDSELRRSLLAVLKVISLVAPKFVRASLVAVLTQSGSSPHIELDYLRDQWQDIGDAHLFNEIVHASTDEQRGNRTYLMDIGSLQSAEWKRTNSWSTTESWNRHLTDTLNPNDAEPRLLIEARLVGVQDYLISMDDGDERITLAIDAMLDARNPIVRDTVNSIMLHKIIESQSASARILANFMSDTLKTIGLAAQKRTVTDRQHIFLSMLAQFQLPEGLLNRVLPKSLNSRDWRAEPQLLRLVPMAADGGVRSAQRLLDQVNASPERFSDDEMGHLFGSLAMHAPKTVDVFGAVLSIALKTRRTADLEKIVNSSERSRQSLASFIPQIFAYACGLLDADGESQKQGSSLLASLMQKAQLDLDWSELRRLLDSIEKPEILNPIISAMWSQPSLGDTDRKFAYLSTFIHVDPSASPPVTRPAGKGNLPISTVVTCHEAMLRLLTLREQISEIYWPTIRTLGLYEFDSSEIFVNGTRFVVVCEYLSKLAADYPKSASVFLIDYLKELSKGGFFGINPILWRRELRNVIRLVCGFGFGVTANALLDVGARLDDELAEVIAEAVAEQSYREVKERLHEISRSATVSEGFRDFVIDLIRMHDRRLGTQAFPELLEAMKSM